MRTDEYASLSIKVVKEVVGNDPSIFDYDITVTIGDKWEMFFKDGSAGDGSWTVAEGSFAEAALYLNQSPEVLRDLLNSITALNITALVYE